VLVPVRAAAAAVEAASRLRNGSPLKCMENVQKDMSLGARLKRNFCGVGDLARRAARETGTQNN